MRTKVPHALYSSRMNGLHERLLQIERALGGGDGDAYRAHRPTPVNP
jgi:hypothetical protein